VISSVWGGVVTTSNDQIAERIGEIYKDLSAPSRAWAMKQLLHPLLFAIIIPTYYLFGKYLLAFLRIVRGIGLAVSQKERMGERPSMFPARMPEALAELALHQFDKLERYNEHRREIASIYSDKLRDGAIYLRFNIRHPNAKEIIKSAKRQHILLGDWYKNVIDPIGTDFAAMKYAPGSCPNAERAAHESINLPTHINISPKDAEHIIQYLRNYR
jgi:dTDP-4-amino-4,6-dideoxygalactose transaminase